MIFTRSENFVTFTVRVIPRSSKSEIVGEYDGSLKIKLNSPPVDGAANSELIKLLAREFGVSKSQVEIMSGTTSKLKQIKLHGANEAALQGIFRPPKPQKQ
jgi:uncharacterized protein (TIGR00251 family)